MILASIDSLLKGIGCNMSANAPRDHFPEECLVLLSTSILEDPKALTLAIGAIQAHSEVLHPEHLLKILTSKDCDPNVIAALLLKTKDRRFSKVIEQCKSLKHSSLKPHKTLTLSLEIGQSALDIDFKSFGIEISTMDSVDVKKISTLSHFAKNSLYIRNRLLYGCNWRADIISLIGLGYEGPTEIKNRIHCSYETAHRIYNNFTLAKNLTA